MTKPGFRPFRATVTHLGCVVLEYRDDDGTHIELSCPEPYIEEDISDEP